MLALPAYQDSLQYVPIAFRKQLQKNKKSPTSKNPQITTNNDEEENKEHKDKKTIDYEKLKEYVDLPYLRND